MPWCSGLGQRTASLALREQMIAQATGCVLTMHGVEEALYALHEHESVGTICIQPVGKQDEGVQLEPLSLSSCLCLLVVHKDDVEANEEARIFCAPGAADEGLRRGRVREARRNTRDRYAGEGATYLSSPSAQAARPLATHCSVSP